jgi:hypothetical protein
VQLQRASRNPQEQFHKVTVTGTLRPESAEKEKAEAQETKSNETIEAGDIRVTALQMVSEKCQ